MDGAASAGAVGGDGPGDSVQDPPPLALQLASMAAFARAHDVLLTREQLREGLRDGYEEENGGQMAAGDAARKVAGGVSIFVDADDL